MTEETTRLYQDMDEALGEIAKKSDNILQLAERSYLVVERTLSELKNYILSYTFKDNDEEIRFFKEIKPMFLRELLYYMEVYQVELWKSPVGRDEEIRHYGLGIRRVDFYFKRYNELYAYYRKGSSENDQRYFLRMEVAPDLITPISFSDIDPRFSTIYSFQFAKMQAYEQFSNYLQQCIYRLEHPGMELIKDGNAKSRNLWTDSKAALIELAYAIHAHGSVNHGKGDIKLLVSKMEALFNIQVGNFYRTMQNMRIRKKRKTPFLDDLKESLEHWMDNTDTNS